MGFVENRKLAKDINNNTKENTEEIKALISSVNSQLTQMNDLVSSMAGKYVSKAYVDNGDATLDARVEELKETLWKNDTSGLLLMPELETYIVEESDESDGYNYYTFAKLKREDIDRFNYILIYYKDSDGIRQYGVFNIKKNQFDIVMDTDAGSGVVYYNTNEFYWNLPSGGGNAYYGFKIQDDSLIYYLHYLESEYTQYPPTISTCLTNTKVRFV